MFLSTLLSTYENYVVTATLFCFGASPIAPFSNIICNPLVLYVFVFSKITPDWMAGIVITLLFTGFTASLEKFINSGCMNNTDIEKFTKTQLIQSKLTAVNWAKEKRTELSALKSQFTDEEYYQKLDLINNKLNTRIRLIDDELNRRITIIELSILGLIILFILWLQPWEPPIEKIRDEWIACNSKYDGQCSFIGNRYKTNTFEMTISETLHGDYDDKECSRSTYNDRC